MRSRLFLGFLVFLLIVSFSFSQVAARDQFIRLGCGGPGAFRTCGLLPLCAQHLFVPWWVGPFGGRYRAES